MSNHEQAPAIWQHPAFGAGIMAVATLLAIIIENSSYMQLADSFLATKGSIRIGNLALEKSLLHWINDALMAIFFFVVGLEIKRELLIGALSSRDKALLPLIAAIGGMIVPAGIYTMLTASNPENARGWAIPTATDIAFAVALLAVLGSRVPASLKAFLLALAIIDDLGAILIIAAFYTSNLSGLALALAGIGCAVLFAMNRFGITKHSTYMLVGFFVWVCVLKSGVHATLAGVLVAISIPLLNTDGSRKPEFEALEHMLHPWVNLLILPLFAFANAGVSFAGLSFGTLLNPLPLGITLGLLIGKPLGITSAVWLAQRFRLASLPTAATWPQLVGVATICGIGFTMSLFIGMLAFSDVAKSGEVRLGVLAGSILAAAIGTAILVAYGRPQMTPK
ncbi:MAG: Na+/H+ antiporter NhaA [Hyphomicrobiaceae bacterium]|nr:Na+/H+ antiporter NhaA [Hyphomicrobiaceae bacterium]